MSQLLVAADYSIKAVYSDNIIFLLASDGGTFSSIDPEGNCVTQLTLNAIQRHRARLAEVVKFRNLHVQPALSIPAVQVTYYSLGHKFS